MPKYHVGDRVKVGRTIYTITGLTGRPTNCYEIRGPKGGVYICGDDKISEVNGVAVEGFLHPDPRRRNFGTTDYRVFANTFAHNDRANADLWKIVEGLNVGDRIQIMRRGRPEFCTFDDAKLHAGKPFIAYTTSRGAKRLGPITNLMVDGKVMPAAKAPAVSHDPEPDVHSDDLSAEDRQTIVDAVNELSLMHEYCDLTKLKSDWREQYGGDRKAEDAREAILFAQLEAIEERQKPKGYVEGRMVSFAVADSAAYYMIWSIGPTKTKLMHVPFGDNWRERTVGADGMILTRTLRGIMEAEDSFREIFAKNIRKGPED